MVQKVQTRVCVGRGHQLSPAQLRLRTQPGAQTPQFRASQTPWAGVSKGLPRSPQIIIHGGACVCVGKESGLRIYLLTFNRASPISLYEGSQLPNPLFTPWYPEVTAPQDKGFDHE